MSKEIILKSLKFRNFKGIKDLTIDVNSKIINIFGENATGKTSVFDGFTWLLFDKDSSDRKNFEIKTLDKNNEVIHGLEHEVTGVLLIDGRQITLTKIHKEKWTKRKGEAEKALTGTETLYYIDEVPVKQSEYQDKINSFINENIFKLITNPLYFSINLKWPERRNIILEIVGDIDSERIINYKSSLKGLEVLLVDKDIDTLKKSISARKRKLNDDLKSIPFRIDETNNSIKEFEFEALELQKRSVVTAIRLVEEKILDSSKVNDGLLEQKDELYKLKSKLKDIEYRIRSTAANPLNDLNNELNRLNQEVQQHIFKVNTFEGRRSSNENIINSLTKEMDRLRSTWSDVNSSTLEFNKDEFICPTCKRAFEEHDIEDKKHEMHENFNSVKAKRLTDIRSNGTEKKNRVDELTKDNEKIIENISLLNEKLDHLNIKKQELEEAIKDFSTADIDFESNEEYAAVKNQITELENKLQQPDASATINNNDLKLKKIELEKDLEDINSKLFYKKNNEELRVRVSELMDKERELSQQFAELEGQEFLCEEFIKTKVELLESSINNKFKFVSFKLFNTLVNGAIEECCEALINGVPFGNANTASQINAGLDIINALSGYYEATAPIFIDNRESINQILDTEAQVINLVVSKDKKLRIEGNSHFEISEEDKKYFEDKIQAIKDNITCRSNGCIVDDLFHEAGQIREDMVGESRWSIQKVAYFEYKNQYFAVSWDDPATEMQEGQDTNCEIYIVNPVKKEIIDFE